MDNRRPQNTSQLHTFQRSSLLRLCTDPDQRRINDYNHPVCLVSARFGNFVWSLKRNDLVFREKRRFRTSNWSFCIQSTFSSAFWPHIANNSQLLLLVTDYIANHQVFHTKAIVTISSSCGHKSRSSTLPQPTWMSPWPLFIQPLCLNMLAKLNLRCCLQFTAYNPA